MKISGIKNSVVKRAWERLEILGDISDDSDGLTRIFLSPSHRAAASKVMDWMRDAGLLVQHDTFGNIRGIQESKLSTSKPLLLGSHLDTVINAGKYDGALGIIVALAAIELLNEAGKEQSINVHLLGFADEEGVRFHATYLGSRACTSQIDDATLALTDATGRSLAQVLEDEGWHDDADNICYKRGNAAAYVEVHIEQGRVLEESRCALGVVPSICGQTRALVTLVGHAEHSGTTPMNMRRDALAGAAACVLAIEDIANAIAGLVATVGKMTVVPGASNAVPGRVDFTLDVRHPEDDVRQMAMYDIDAACKHIAHDRHLQCTMEVVQEMAAVECEESITRLLEMAVLGEGKNSVPRIPSGAGHDAVAMAAVMPVGMLFVRCRKGLSHHPDESITIEDLALAIEATARFLASWAKGGFLQ